MPRWPYQKERRPKQEESKDKPKDNQKETKPQPNENVNVNDNDNANVFIRLELNDKSLFPIFDDDLGKMDFSILDQEYELLLISQFTLFASLHKGFRPSFNHAASPTFAVSKYCEFIQLIKQKFTGHIATGEFGADMKIQSIDDGPVSLWLDSKAKNY